MILKANVMNGKYQVEIEVDTYADCVREIAALEDVFGNTTCEQVVDGKVITSDNVRFTVRKNKEEDEFFELVCLDKNPKLRYAKKSFGVTKKGGYLFPHRKDKDGKFLPNNGWVKWEKNAQTGGTPDPVQSNSESGNKAPF